MQSYKKISKLPNISFLHKKVASSDICLTTYDLLYDLLLIVYKRLFCCVFEAFHHREDEQS